MTNRKAQMLADQRLRDSARALIEADIEHLKGDLSHKGVGERAFDRVREGALDIYEEAIDIADNNRGALAASVAAIIIWFARKPIFSAFGINTEEEDYHHNSDEDEKAQ